MNVFLRELKMMRNSTMGWIVALILVTLMFLSIFPAFNSDIDTSRKLLANFPPQIRNMLGLSLTTFFTFLGFYAYTLTYISLIGAAQAMNLGLTILSREPRTKTTDFLLTKPISRSQVFGSKLLAAFCVLVLTNIVLIIATVLLTIVFGAWGFSIRTYSLLAIGFFLIQVVCLAIGVFISQCMRIKSVVTVSLAVTFGFFAISLLQSLSNDKILRYFTPFKFFDNMNIVATRQLESVFLVVAVLVVTFALGAGYLRFCYRDTRSVT